MREWCIPPKQNAGFVAAMERVLKVYARPYDPERPVVCMDEMPKQLLGEARPPIRTKPGRPRKVDSEYVRLGTCSVWMFVEPLGGWRETSATARRTGVDWAHRVKALVDHPRYSDAVRITLVMDNLSTHSLASLYATFEPSEASRLADKLELVYTPKHGSWLNIAESEFSVLSRQCTKARVESREKLDQAVRAWCESRNRSQIGVRWHLTQEDARTKLQSIYPTIILEPTT